MSKYFLFSLDLNYSSLDIKFPTFKLIMLHSIFLCLVLKEFVYWSYKIIIVFIDDYPNDSSAYLTEILDFIENHKLHP